MSYRVLIFGQAEKEHNIALEKLVISFRGKHRIKY